MKAYTYSLPLLLCWLSWGCATKGDLQKVETDQVRMQTQITSLKDKQIRILADIATIQKRLAEIQQILKNFTKEGRVNFAEFDTKLDELRRDHQQLLGRYQLLEISFNNLKEKHEKLYAAYSASFGDPSASKNDPKVTVEVVTAEGILKGAQVLFQNKQYEKARDRLKELVKKYPADDLTDDALILLGDCFYHMNNYLEAVVHYNTVRKKYTSGNQVDTAYLRLGESFYQMKDCNGGKAFFNALIKRYPSSKHVDRAREMVRNVRRLCKR